MIDFPPPRSRVERQRSIIDFSVHNLLRRRSKNLSIVIIYILLVFSVSSVLFITGSLTKELLNTVDELPDITIQKIQGGRQVYITEHYIKKIQRIRGVHTVEPRVWGYIYFKEAGANFTLFGMDPALWDENTYEKVNDWKTLHHQTELSFHNKMIVGRGVYNLLKKYRQEKQFMFFQSSRQQPVAFDIIGIFDSKLELQSSDLLVMGTGDAGKILDLPEGTYTDLVLHVPNPEEVETIALKIQRRYPELRVITRSHIQSTYETVFGWKSGFVLSSLSIAILAFLILTWDRAGGLSREEKREIGILKAIGWDTEMVLAIKLREGIILSVFSSIIGILLAYIFVYKFQAPGLREIFIGWSVVYPPYRLVAGNNVNQILLIITIAVIPYCTAIIIPSWKAATTDPDFITRENE